MLLDIRHQRRELRHLLIHELAGHRVMHADRRGELHHLDILAAFSVFALVLGVECYLRLLGLRVEHVDRQLLFR